MLCNARNRIRKTSHKSLQKVHVHAYYFHLDLLSLDKYINMCMGFMMSTITAPVVCSFSYYSALCRDQTGTGWLSMALKVLIVNPPSPPT